ncbi:YbjN domain-containing protein [Corynebacterium timonense]|uniref:Putative sensory transduction regulator n=1 Tax=Corynebacterium timonense TaxID=441500 RepID=A0A1H1NQN9_9CORY|nr:YbjN domain-containing protein [Corynebacterium timonense]SDS01281.1 Putative sensory transduction regulator [Corynebacterium timonense]
MSTNTATATQVTVDRAIAAMASHGVELSDDPSGRVARCTLNGLDVLFVLLDSVLIVRADTRTDIPADTPDATLYLSANQANSTLLGARAVVVNRGETITVRTEAELPVGAGLTDVQLAAALKRAVDGVVRGQDAMTALSESIAEQRAGDGS